MIYAIAVLIGITVSLGIDWVLWHLWMLVVPYFFPNASEHWQRPEFWMFVFAVALVGFIGKCLFPSRTESSK